MKYRKNPVQSNHNCIQRFPSGTDLRISPENRLCAKFDPVSIATFPVSHEVAPATRIVDNCAEEHIM